MPERITHDRIMQLATGFWASKTFLSAIELGVFGAFADGALRLPELRKRLGLHERSARDFFDALVAIGLLQRDEAGRYSNSEEAELYLNPAKPGYMGGLIEMLNTRLYGFWGSLTEALRTGEPQNEAKQGGDLFARFMRTRLRLEGFLRAMGAQSLPVARTLAEVFPWKDVRRSSISAPHRDASRSSWRLPIPISAAAVLICPRWNLSFPAMSPRTACPTAAFRPGRLLRG